MTELDRELKELQQKIGRKGHLEAVRAELRAQQSTLTQRVAELNRIKVEEQSDVSRLEGGSLARFFYNVIGKLDEKLDTERAEAYAAAVKYDTAVRELAAVEEDLRRNAAEWNEILACERRYEQLKKEKAELIRASGTPEEQELLRLEELIARLEHQVKEVDEAIRAGRSAMQTADSVLESLNSAEGWATWDMLGGGLLTDIAKHERLDEAQDAVSRLQGQLRRFKTELADVEVRADMRVTVEGFTRFADFFFDGLFADWAVRDEIHQSQDQVLAVKSQISHSLRQLDALRRSNENALVRARQELDALMTKTV